MESDGHADEVRWTWFGWLALSVDAILCNLLAIAVSPVVIALLVLEWWRENRPPEVVRDGD